MIGGYDSRAQGDTQPSVVSLHTNSTNIKLHAKIQMCMYANGAHTHTNMHTSSHIVSDE